MKTRRSRQFRPQVEPLESRLVPTTFTWDGGGNNDNWSNRFNWVGDQAPGSGDALVFPSDA